MNIQTALLELGVAESTLTTDEKAQLDRNGYLPLTNILSPEQIRAFRDRLDALVAAEGAEAGKEVHQEAGTDRLSDLVNKGDLFTICFTHPRVLAAISHVLQGEFKLSSLNFRAALPGDGLQALNLRCQTCHALADPFEVRIQPFDCTRVCRLSQQVTVRFDD